MERLTGAAVTSGQVTFNGTTNASALITDGGRYEVRLMPGTYTVTITDAGIVPHETRGLFVTTSTEMPFSVIRWGTKKDEADYDETFHRFFHQLARVGGASDQLRKWVIRPTELYVVAGSVSNTDLEGLERAVREVNAIVPDLWCNWVQTLAVNVGPDFSGSVDGRVAIRPNFNAGSSATLGPSSIRSGTINVNMYTVDGAKRTHQEILATLSHELFHVSGAFHVCGGPMGSNPFNFSREHCPFPQSLMANLGDPVTRPSAQDRLAACLVYASGTAPGNMFQDINPIHRY